MNGWKRKRRQQALEQRLRALSPEDCQKVRAYLSVNAGDEVFVREFLSARTHQVERRGKASNERVLSPAAGSTLRDTGSARGFPPRRRPPQKL
jgi:hypothetical protein